MYRTAPILAVLAVTALATPAKAEDWDFVLINNTHAVIERIEVATAGSDNWTPGSVDQDLGSGGKVAAGGKATVQFDRMNNACRFDIRATFADRTTTVWHRINICDNSYVTLSFTGGKPTFKEN